jgi:hypothetical protein
MVAQHYLDLFAGKDTPEARAAALRLDRAIGLYIGRCEAEADAAKRRR